MAIRRLEPLWQSLNAELPSDGRTLCGPLPQAFLSALCFRVVCAKGPSYPYMRGSIQSSLFCDLTHPTKYKSSQSVHVVRGRIACLMKAEDYSINCIRHTLLPPFLLPPAKLWWCMTNRQCPTNMHTCTCREEDLAGRHLHHCSWNRWLARSTANSSSSPSV